MQLHRTVILALLLISVSFSATRADNAPPWAESARKIHDRFTGRRGTFAQFGDSLTYSSAYWYTLLYKHNNMSPAAQQAYENVNAYMSKACWYTWKGPKYGSEAGKNLIWASEHIDEWLKELNPETALILFGFDEFGQMPLDQYEQKLREVVQKCCDNGTIVILSTLPPRHDGLDKVKQYSDVIRKVSTEMKLPLINFLDECLTRRPNDWDSATKEFRAAKKANPALETLLGWNGIGLTYSNKYSGDYSDEALRNCGYGLRTYLTLMAYDQVIARVLK